jgi:ribosomal protein S27AE
MGKRLIQEDVDKRILNICLDMGYELIEPFEYKNNKTKIKLKCLKDDYEWEITYNKLINQKQGCPKCGGSLKISQEQAEINVNNRCIELGYELIESFIYKNCKTILYLKCLKDEYKWNVSYLNFIYGKKGCPKCSGTLKLTQQEANKYVLDRCKEINYQLIEPFIYTTARKTIIHLMCLIDNHKWGVIYDSFINGKRGCPICKESNLEREVKVFLEKNNIKLDRQKRFEWLGLQSLDFYLPEHNIAIECQGIQHFKPTDFSHRCKECAIIEFENIKINDKNKFTLCQEYGIKLLYYTKKAKYLPDQYFSKIYTNLDELKNEIK